MRLRERDRLALVSVSLVCISGRDLWSLEWDVGKFGLSMKVLGVALVISSIEASTFHIQHVEYWNIK